MNLGDKIRNVHTGWSGVVIELDTEWVTVAYDHGRKGVESHLRADETIQPELTE